MNTKLVIQKLLKIAENQQKIINKLAQDQMANDLKGVCQSILNKLTPGYTVTQADGPVNDMVRVTVTPKLQGQVAGQFRDAVASHTNVSPENVNVA